MVEKISNTAAVKAALAAGVDKPQDIAEWVKKTYKLEIGTKQISVIKSSAKKKGEEGGESTARKPGRQPALPPVVSIVPQNSNGDGFSIGDIQAVQKLLNDMGARKAIALIDALEPPQSR